VTGEVSKGGTTGVTGRISRSDRKVGKSDRKVGKSDRKGEQEWQEGSAGVTGRVSRSDRKGQQE
jgi:hypothetical protein